MGIADRLLLGGAAFLLFNEGGGVLVLALLGSGFGFDVTTLQKAAVLMLLASVAAFAGVVLMAWWPRAAALASTVLVLGLHAWLVPLLGPEVLVWTAVPTGLAIAACVLALRRRPRAAVQSWIPVS